MRALVIGNCQAPGLAACLGLLRPGWEVGHVPLARLAAADLRADPGAWTFDRIFTQVTALPIIERNRDVLAAPVTLVPRIVFRGFHPDMVLAVVDRRHVEGITGPFHSALALAAFRRGLDEAATLDLFHDRTFRTLGYFDAWQPALAQLMDEGRRVGLPFEAAFGAWRRRGCFMHAITQPHLFVLADIAAALLAREGLPAAVADPAAFLHDALADEAVWGVYPAVAERLGVPGSFTFKAPGQGRERVLHVEAFVRGSFAVYRTLPAERLSSPGLDPERYDAVLRTPSASVRVPAAAVGPAHPYRRLPAERHWRTGVLAAGPDGPDPADGAPFRLHPTDRIATAGSCFAQHLAPALQARGFRRFEVEPGTDTAPSPYAARYGNLYTARQLLQLIERAFGRFRPAESAWQRPDGRFVDPFRPMVEPAGFTDVAAVEAARERHLEAVRYLFTRLDAFVFTLGLTEAWTAPADGAVYPLAPGVVAGAPDPARYRFVNFDVASVAADLRAFHERLRAINPTARMVLTVSPVPLAATYEARHVLVSTAASKAVLRAAADEVVRATPKVGYFPAYEIVQEMDGRGLAFGPDRRAVGPLAVARVVQLFVRHWTTAGPDTRSAAAIDPAFELVCEEDRLSMV